MLNGKQYEQLLDAMADAFPTPEDLERMVRLRLGKNLHRISSAPDLDQKIFKLIERAEAEGWTAELVTRARESRPHNSTLLAFATQFALAPTMVSGSTSEPIAPSALEALVKGSSKLMDVTRWRERLGEVEGRVCRIEVPTNRGTLTGTGFLVGPDLVMTNHHVVEAVIEGERASATSDGVKANARDVVVRFDYKRLANGLTTNPGTTFALAADWLVDSSPPSAVDVEAPSADAVPSEDELDYALLRLEGTPGDETIGGKREEGAPKRGWIKPPRKLDVPLGTSVLILQHPDGAPLKLAMASDGVIGFNANRTRVMYKTSTLPGSSGSPCFTMDWDLFAIHHAGDPQWGGGRDAEHNRGIPFAAIQRRLERQGMTLGG